MQKKKNEEINIIKKDRERLMGLFYSLSPEEIRGIKEVLIASLLAQEGRGKRNLEEDGHG